VEAEAIRITHKEGIALVDFDDLPPAMQAEYGWTPEKSAARKAAREAEAKRIAEEERMEEEELKRRSPKARAEAPPEPVRVVDEEKLKAETEEALRESRAEAARLRAQIDLERRGGAPATQEVAPGTAEPGVEAPAKPSENSPPRVSPPVSAVGTISSLIGEEKKAAGNRNLLIAACVSAAIVLLLFILSAGKSKKSGPR
jgi:hypothetical protein